MKVVYTSGVFPISERRELERMCRKEGNKLVQTDVITPPMKQFRCEYSSP